MALFRTKSPEAKAAALAEELIRSRYVNARGELHDAVLNAASNGGADPRWVASVMPGMARETAEAWLNVHPEPSEADLKELWEKDLRAFWHRSYWDNFTTPIKDLAQEISVAVQNEVVRQLALREGAGPAADGLGELGPSWSSTATDADAGTPSTEVAVEEDDAPAAVGVARAIEVWRWENAEKLSDSARSRLDRVARLVSDNAIGSQDVTDVEPGGEIEFEETVSDMKHGLEMIQHVARWVAEDPAKFDVALGLYLDGGGASDGLDMPAGIE